jgi:L-ascorbate metabolism protein UlaG (beta-lactamase superfamily)
MGVKEASVAAALMRPQAVIPCHYDTFPNQAADLNDLENRIGQLTPRTRLLPMKPGDALSFP